VSILPPEVKTRPRPIFFWADTDVFEFSLPMSDTDIFYYSSSISFTS